MNHDGLDEPRYVYCWACGGSGTRQAEHHLTSCPICKGEGEIPDEEEAGAT